MGENIFRPLITSSDSTATTLACIFYHLALYPQYQRQLQEELKSVASLHDFNHLETLPVLRSIIHETLRLFPPVPTAPARLSPTGGLLIGGKFIPEGIAIFTPRYVIARCKCFKIVCVPFSARRANLRAVESCFERAKEFIPERWSSKPEMVKDKRAWAPFSRGSLLQFRSSPL